MKKLYFLLLSIFVSAVSFSYSIFQKSYGDVGVDNGQMIISTSDSGYAILGDAIQNFPDSTDIAVYRLSQIGDLSWSVKIGVPGDEFARDMKETSDGGFIIVGTTYASPLDTSHGDIFAIKIDATGFVVWSMIYGGTEQDDAYGVINAPDGGFIILGSTESYGSALASAIAFKIDANGFQRWVTVSSTSPDNYFYRGILASDGNYVIAGGTDNTIGGSQQDHYINKIDTAGNIIWAKRYGTFQSDSLFDISETSDGGFICAGMNFSNATDFDQNIFKIDSAGTVIWNNSYGTAQYDQAGSVFENTLNEYVVCGYTNVGSQFNVIYQLVINVFDNSGNLIWANTYGDPSATSYGKYIIPGTDHGYAAVGFFTSISDPNGDAYFVKVDSAGNSGCFQLPLHLFNHLNSFSDSTGSDVTHPLITEFPQTMFSNYYVNQFSINCISDDIAAIDEMPLVSIYPNPANDFVSISMKNPGADAQVIISDVTGKIIFQSAVSKSGELKVNTGNFSSGFYIVKVVSNGRISCTPLIRK
jgi:hypothetical protein